MPVGDRRATWNNVLRRINKGMYQMSYFTLLEGENKTMNNTNYSSRYLNPVG